MYGEKPKRFSHAYILSANIATPLKLNGIPFKCHIYFPEIDSKCGFMYNVQWRFGSFYSFWMTIAEAAPPPLQMPAAPNSPDFNA